MDTAANLAIPVIQDFHFRTEILHFKTTLKDHLSVFEM